MSTRQLTDNPDNDDEEEIIRLMLAHAEYGTYDVSSQAFQSSSDNPTSGLFGAEESITAPVYDAVPGLEPVYPFQPFNIDTQSRSAPPSTSTLATSMIMPWLPTSQASSSSSSLSSSTSKSDDRLVGSPSRSTPAFTFPPTFDVSRPRPALLTTTSAPTTSLAQIMTSTPIAAEGSSRAGRTRSSSASDEIPACDQCRRRKVKCDRQQPICAVCARLGLECTTKDELRRRGPPTKARRSEMRRAGLIYDRGMRRWRAARPEEAVTLDESETSQSSQRGKGKSREEDPSSS